MNESKKMKRGKSHNRLQHNSREYKYKIITNSNSQYNSKLSHKSELEDIKAISKANSIPKIRMNPRVNMASLIEESKVLKNKYKITKTNEPDNLVKKMDAGEINNIKDAKINNNKILDKYEYNKELLCETGQTPEKQTKAMKPYKTIGNNKIN